MQQMNFPITNELAGYVRKKVKSAATTMPAKSSAKGAAPGDEDERALRLAKPSAEDLIGT
jgi:hypothetical protein